MKISLYFDIYPWTTSENVAVFSRSYVPERNKLAKRYQVNVEVPDPAEPDEVLEAKAMRLEEVRAGAAEVSEELERAKL